MAGLADVFLLILMSASFIGAILGTALIAQKCQALIDATKDSLEECGWLDSNAHLREAGGGGGGSSVVLVKTGKKRIMDHERYLDATQRGLVKAFNASTFGAPSSQSQSAAAAASSASAAPAWPGLGLSASSSLGTAASAVAAVARRSQQVPLLSSQQPDTGKPGAGSPGPVVVGAGAGDRRKGGSGTGADATRDSIHEMAGRLSAWSSEKIEKAKHLKDKLLSKF